MASTYRLSLWPKVSSPLPIAWRVSICAGWTAWRCSFQAWATSHTSIWGSQGRSKQIYIAFNSPCRWRQDTVEATLLINSTPYPVPASDRIIMRKMTGDLMRWSELTSIFGDEKLQFVRRLQTLIIVRIVDYQISLSRYITKNIGTYAID